MAIFFLHLTNAAYSKLELRLFHNYHQHVPQTLLAAPLASMTAVMDLIVLLLSKPNLVHKSVISQS